jgi:two-component system, chemotaxis family, protein-glutamate methylesterase/glutaminase
MTAVQPPPGPPWDATRARVIVVGASAGAVDALSAILPALPRGYPIPVIVVVHLPAGRPSAMTDLFRAKCEVEVREVEDKEPLLAGVIYFAPPDYHVLLESDQRLSLSVEDPVNFSRPSVDVLFESAADAYGPDVIGIILTGANGDGARGLRAIQAAGGTVIVQKPELAHAPEMPVAALAACPGAIVLGLDRIAACLNEVVTSR